MENYFSNKNVLITGGLGFLGSNLAHKLLKAGANVTVIDNLAPLYGGNFYNIETIKSKITIIINDMRNMEILLPIIEKTNIIFHMAAQVSYIDSNNMPYEDLDLNARATLNILECCRRINLSAKIIFASSRMVYGKVDGLIVHENSPTNPLSLYGIHKLTSEKYLMMYYKDFGIPSTVLRLTNPYGPKQQIKHSKYSLVGWFIRQAMEGKPIRIFGDGAQLRDYIYVDDIINAMLKCTESECAVGEVINVGSGESTKFSDMVKIVVSTVQSATMEFVPWPENYEKVETGDISMDISKLEMITGWKPEVSLKEGVFKTYEFYKNNSAYYI